MVKHIVMFRLKSSFEQEEKQKHLKTLKTRLDNLVHFIPEIKHLETGINISNSPAAYDLALYTEFADEDKLNIYRKHPEHQSVLEFIKEVKEDIVVVDY